LGGTGLTPADVVMQNIEASSGLNFSQPIIVGNLTQQLEAILGDTVNISQFLDNAIGMPSISLTPLPLFVLRLTVS
jgi:hypothetical protein